MRKRGDAFVLLGVRELHEIAICAFPDSVRIPLGSLAANLSRLSTADGIIAHCRFGRP